RTAHFCRSKSAATISVFRPSPGPASRSTRAAFTGPVRPSPRLEALPLLSYGVQILSGLAVPAAGFLLFFSGGTILLVVLLGGPVDRGQQRRLFLLNGLQI